MLYIICGGILFLKHRHIFSCKNLFLYKSHTKSDLQEIAQVLQTTIKPLQNSCSSQLYTNIYSTGSTVA